MFLSVALILPLSLPSSLSKVNKHILNRVFFKSVPQKHLEVSAKVYRTSGAEAQP